jgi:predicted nucleic acid-binding protein
VTGYLLDTSALSAYLHPGHAHHASAVKVIDGLPADATKVIAVATLAELDFGIRLAEHAGSSRLNEYRDRLRIVREYTCLGMSQHTADEYAALKAKLAARVLKNAGANLPRWIEDWVDLGSGKRLQIDENDLWICALAKERDLVLVTGDGDMRTLASIDPDLRILLTTP